MTIESICIPVAIPPELCAIDDERKAIYHSAETICVWVFADRETRNRFMDETIGMTKVEREAMFEARYRNAG